MSLLILLANGVIFLMEASRRWCLVLFSLFLLVISIEHPVSGGVEYPDHVLMSVLVRFNPNPCCRGNNILRNKYS